VNSASRPALVFLAALVAAFLLYWAPQLGATLTSDVTWIYRVQVSAAGALPPVPEGLRYFSGAPMGWVEACVAHYEAFRRLNCADIVLWRLSALFAGESAPGWLAISLVINCATLVVVEAILRRLAMPWPVRAFALLGLFFAPPEVWTTAVTSEPRVGLAVSFAILAALHGRAVLAAIAMALSVLIKEPTIVWWPFVASLSLVPLDGGVRWRSLVPHVIAGAILLAVGLVIWFLVPAVNNYPFLLRTPYPEVASFITGAVAGAVPLLVRPNPWWAAIAVMAVLVFDIVRGGRGGALLRDLRQPSWWLPILAGIAAIAGHLAVHWLTRRVVGDSRYIVPANIGAVILIALVLRPFLLQTGRAALLVAGLVAAAMVLLQFPWSTMEWVAFGVVAAAIGALLAFVVWFIARLVGRRLPALAVAAVAFASFVMTPAVDAALQSNARLVINSRDWNDTMTAISAELPPRAFATLSTSDPLMLETVMGLQAEFLFRNRPDLDFRAEPRDTSFYDAEDGLVRRAHDAFNTGRPTEEEARAENRPLFAIDLDRNGAAVSAPRPALSWRDWLGLLAANPEAFIQRRYYEGQAGYLNATVARLD
jgi:hypothetical protein